MKIYFSLYKIYSSRKTRTRANLEKKLKILNKNLDEDDYLSKYNSIKTEFDAIYDLTTEGIRIRSFTFLNLEKKRGDQNTIKKKTIVDEEITDYIHILEFYEIL